ncbi:MAG: dTDP-4-dehydrorhamnose 3,5-epimerase [Bacteroidota bacterium]
MGFRKYETSIPDLFLIEPDVFSDDRGFFMELFNDNSFEKIGLGHLRFLQDNLSSSQKGTLRGLHFQAPPFAQGKLVSVLEGAVLDVVVDIRKESPTYGKSYAVELNSQSRKMLFIPGGFAHGFQVLSESCLFFYKCTEVYHKNSEGGLAWNDPALEVAWRDIPPILSEKDRHHPKLSDFQSPFV